MTETTRTMIAKPMSVGGIAVTGCEIATIIDALTNTPATFTNEHLLDHVPVPPNAGSYVWWQKEVLNRLFQRWRKLGLMDHDARGWTLARGAWATLQDGAAHARAAS